VLISPLYKNSVDFNNAYFCRWNQNIWGGGPGQHLGGRAVPPRPHVEPPLRRDSEIGCKYNFLKYLAFTYFIMLRSEMIEMTRCPRHCYSVTGALCKMVLSADDKVLIKSLYQFSGGLVQTFH